MPRKPKSKPPETPASAVPESVKQSRVYQRRKVTKRKLPSFTEAMMLLHAPEALRLYWEALLEGLKRGDKYALEAAGEIFNYVRGKGINLNLTQQMMAQNVAAGEQSPVVGFDAFARRLAEARAGHALPPPAEVLQLEAAEVRPAETLKTTP